MTSHETIERSIAKLSYLNITIAQHRRGDMIDTDGLSCILEDVIEEIKEALESLEEKPVRKPANLAA